MSNKEALRVLQQRLATRLKEAQAAAEIPASWLAVEVAGHGLLLPLAQAGEIFPVGAITPVPHTVDWFAGVTSLRGNLHAVVDLARFLGLRSSGHEAPREQARLVSFNAELQTNAAVLVDALAGLRQPSQLREIAADHAPAGLPSFVGARYLDAQQRVWQAVSLAELAAHDHFLSIKAAA